MNQKVSPVAGCAVVLVFAIGMLLWKSSPHSSGTKSPGEPNAAPPTTSPARQIFPSDSEQSDLAKQPVVNLNPVTEKDLASGKQEQPVEPDPVMIRPVQNGLAIAPLCARFDVGDFRVAVGATSLKIAHVGLSQGEGNLERSEHAYLIISVDIEHLKSRSRTITPWSSQWGIQSPAGARLLDQTGREYQQINLGKRAVFGSSRTRESTTLEFRGQHPLFEMLVFERPIDEATSLSLILPGRAIAIPGDVQVNIPLGKIRR